jgi:carbon storage regulator CsrA
MIKIKSQKMTGIFCIKLLRRKTMHIVTAEKNQKVHIGNDIYLVVKRIREDGEIELGIEAPENVAIHREEFWKIALSIHEKMLLSQLQRPAMRMNR